MIQIRPIVFTLGVVLCAIAATMLLPAIVDLLDGRSSWAVFAGSSAFTLFIGGLMLLVAFLSTLTLVGSALVVNGIG